MSRVVPARAAEVMVDCPACGRSRWISPQRATRIDRGVATGLCRSCKMTPVASLTETVAARSDAPEVRDAHMRWWIRKYGGTIAPGEDVAGYVREHGLHPEFVALVGSIIEP